MAFYLRQEGLTVLEIGGLFTAGLALGSLVVGILYSEVLRRIKLRTGLYLYSALGFLQSFVFFLVPTSFGSVLVKPIIKIKASIGKISEDASVQHNLSKNNHREVMSRSLIIESLALVLGLALAVLLVKWIGFELSFLAFALISLPSVYFFFRVREDTRFKNKKKKPLPKLKPRLKLLIFSELLYWFSLGITGNLIITFLVTDNFEGSIVWLAVIFASLHLTIMLTTYLTQRFFNKRNFYWSSLVGMFFLFLSAIIVIISNDLYVVLAAFIIEGIGAGIWVPSKSALVWKYTQKENRERVSGRVFGLRMSLDSLGPLAGGALATAFGILGPFYLKSGLSVLVMAIYFYLWKKSK
ncbi:MAG: MFS transporter [Candidatus Pacearchaeota archaeon]